MASPLPLSIHGEGRNELIAIAEFYSWDEAYLRFVKTMTCNQLGGACDEQFHASTFAEMAALSKQHAMVMMQQGDEPHLNAMKTMQQNMQSPEAMAAWMDEKQRAFDPLAED